MEVFDFQGMEGCAARRAADGFYVCGNGTVLRWAGRMKGSLSERQGNNGERNVMKDKEVTIHADQSERERESGDSGQQQRLGESTGEGRQEWTGRAEEKYHFYGRSEC